MDNIDVEVRFKDGSRWSATIFALAQAEALMKKSAAAGENLGDRYFWCWDGLIVRDPGIANMTEVLVGLAENGELPHNLRRLDD